MYTSFFNLRKKPFELVPDPEFIYLSQAHKKALTYLDYGIRERAGFILLTGDVGSGKTTLIRDLLEKKYDKVVVAKIFNTRVDSGQLLAMINDDFGLGVAGKDKITLMRDLNDFLLEQYAAGKQPILIIDEAQNLSAEVLEEVRMLSNLECSQGKLLQIMLVGQPELRDTLSTPDMLQLRQRISINCHLKALSLEETARYISHRLCVAGNPQAVVFQRHCLDLIHQNSHGIPRLINIICDFILLAAFAEQTTTVSPALVADIIKDLDFERQFWAGGAAPRAGETDVPLRTRVDAVEKEMSLQLSTALQQVFDTLVLLKQELEARVGKTEALIADLNAKLPALEHRERAEVVSLPQPSPAPGLMRRLFRSVGCH